MGMVGAGLLIAFGFINLAGVFVSEFPIKLRLPEGSHRSMAILMEKASVPAAFVLGLLVGICQFPCMGGPYLMVIGLLRDQVTYYAGFGYLLLYNIILVMPLLAILFISADPILVKKMEDWRRTNSKGVRIWAGIAMIIIGTLIFFM
jgi:cytochrome c biogenesis protein CcdA